MTGSAARWLGGVTAVVATAAVGVTGVIPAQAAVSASSAVIINEVYGGGGNSGSTYKYDFIELFNTSSSAVDLSTWSVQYKSSTGTWANGAQTNLSGTIPAHGYYLVQEAKGTGGTTDLPTPDATGTIAMSGTSGVAALVSSTSRLSCSTSACASASTVVDLVGFGTAADTYAGSGTTPTLSNSTSATRSSTHKNTADNKADFTTGAPTPLNSKSVEPDPDPDPDPDPTPTPTPSPTPSESPSPVDSVTPIAQIQGSGSSSPLVGSQVTTQGVVTAAYPTGGYYGFVIQTPGTGGDTSLANRAASDAVYVYQSSGTVAPTIGQLVQVTGTVSEYYGLTEITVPNASGYQVLGTPAAPVTPVSVPWPTTDADREKLESMLFAPTGTYTVSNTYTANQYSEIGLAFGTTPLIQPTEVGRPGSAEKAAVEADNAARAVVLDDGATTNFLSSKSLTPPYISLTAPVRVGATVQFNSPMIVDYRNNLWKLNPTSTVTSSTPADQRATFTNTRTSAPDAAALGNATLKIASFNVLNYFTTLGENVSGCSSYNDRAGNPITVNTCSGDGPRGAWNTENLQRQQAKIVAAINSLDADVVGLMEIENSAKLAGASKKDAALATLVDALNAKAGAGTWAYVPSSTELPSASLQDVITNALIYRTATATRVGDSRALGTASGSGQAFDNAREPIGQVFAPAGGGEPVFVVVNHLKSKGSAGPLPGDADSGDGQGASNASRVAQATALRDWVPTVISGYQGLEDVALIGDFNSYTAEDPLQVLYAAGYADAISTLAHGQYGYSFNGLSGSLDHVLLNQSALARATGADMWEINAEESIALEYSRYNYHGTLFYDESPYRSSDHDPVIVGLGSGQSPTVDINLLNINDFHGRIDTNTVKLAGTVEQLRAAGGEANTLFLSAGDNIGASLFASSSQKDQPTIDVLNALGLKASAVGNHEFDQGFADLRDRVIGSTTPNAGFPYLGANVYAKGTQTPVLPEYALFDVDGITVGVIGAVTQETPSLVTPAGIADLDFGDAVDAVNRVAAKLSDGDPSNGEADVLVAEYHDGASAGTPDGATLDEEIAAGGPFAKLVTETSAQVDAIFTGHTHKQYAWSAAVPGTDRTRPVVQTGEYGGNVGQIVLTVDRASGAVTAHTERNVARTTTADADLVSAYPRVAQVKTIVDAALAKATEIGSQPIGSVTADVTTAFSGGSYTNGVYTGGVRDDRASESTVGGLVANALRDSLASSDRGGAQIGVVNPGGLRAELLYAPDGVITYAEANSVLPFLNNLWTTTLTGDQLKTMLEQQWQRDANGNVPSRPYLQLGLSDNVSYTYDATRPEGDRITSIRIDGALVTPTSTYRVGTFSFLATGGDNFRIFTQGTNTRDSGLIDRDAWIAYLTAKAPVTPSFARRAVSVHGAPSAAEVGDTVEFDVAKLDLTSLGSPLNTSLSATWKGSSASAVSIPVSGGAAHVAVPVPADAVGDATLQIVAQPSGTTVELPVTVTRSAAATTTALALSATQVTVDDTVTATATVTGATTGQVTFGWADQTRTVSLVDGVATVKLPTLAAGSYQVTATFVETSDALGSTATPVALTVAQRTSSTSISLVPATVSYGTGATARVAVSTNGTAKGSVRVSVDGTIVATQSLVFGQVTTSLPSTLAAGSHTVLAEYLGDAGTVASSASTTLTVTGLTTTTGLSLSATTVTVGSTIKATVNLSAAGSLTLKPTGTVRVKVNGVTVAMASLTATSRGTVTLTLPAFTTVGSQSVEAVYAGGGQFAASSSRVLTVNVTK